MMAGLFFSRVLLSISMGAFLLASFLHPAYKQHFREFLRQPLCWGTSLLFFLPLLSGLWSEDQAQWMQMMTIKLPLFFLPLAFAWPLGFSEKHWRWLIGILAFLILATAMYFLLDYFKYRIIYDQQYLQGKTLDTPLDNDHVRFSLLVFTAIVFCGTQFYRHRKHPLSWIWIGILVLFILYLHLLAARTGLLAFYVSFTGWIIYLLMHARKKMAFVMIVSLLLIPITAWVLMPSFQNKLRLFRYESSFIVNAGYSPFSNDQVRMVSIRAGLNLLKQDPLLGTGYGDIIGKSREWYLKNYPEMREEDKIYPSSQFILFGAGTGMPGLIIFSLVIFLPLFMGMDHPVAWRMIVSGLALSYFFDIGLEVQYGVFLHCFILFLSWQWMKRQNTTSL
jgi:hypothetical protein